MNNGAESKIQENFPQEISSLSTIKSIEQIPGVASVSAEIHELSSISQAYLQNEFYKFSSFLIQISDLSGLNVLVPQLFAVDQNYYQTIMNQYLVMQQGDGFTAFQQLSDSNSFNVLISSEVPQQLNVNLGDYIQVQFERNYNVNRMLAHVVGIYQAMPGAYYAPTFLQFQTIPGIMMDLNDAIKAFGMNAGPESSY